MIIPTKPLAPGARIAMVTPGGMAPERFRKQVEWGIEHLKELGFSPVLDYFTPEKPFDPEDTARLFTEAFKDPSIDAVVPACGGPRVYEILPYLDFKNLNPHGKLFCGMSDLSPLVIILAAETQVPTFYGTHINFLHPKASAPCNSYTVQSFWNMLRATTGGKKKLDRNEKIHLFEYKKDDHQHLSNIYAKNNFIQKEHYRDVVFIAASTTPSWEGTLYASTIGALRRIAEDGLSFDYSGTILLLDTLGQTLEETLSDLKYLHAHTTIAKSTLLYFSSFAERSDREKELPELRDEKALHTFLEKGKELLGVEDMLYGFPSGHSQYRLTIPVGVQARVSAKDGSIEILEKFFV